MKEKIENSIALHQMTINELRELKCRLEDNCTDNVKFIIQTREFNPIDLATFKHKYKLDVSIYTMNLILDEAIRREKERIDKLIDMEIERRLSITDTSKEQPIINAKDNDLCIQFIKDYLSKTDKPNCFFRTLYEKCKTYCEEHNSKIISRKQLSLCLKELGCIIKNKKDADNLAYRYVWFDDIII